MSRWLYREDLDEARERLTTWWNGGDIGRPALQLTVPREEPIEIVEPLPEPKGWTGTPYTTIDFDFRVNRAARACIDTHYLAEAVPNVAPDLAPNCLALYLGCRGVEHPDTVWCEPCIASPEAARFDYDPGNFYWDFTLRLGREMLRLGRDRLFVAFPDLIEGLDTLAAMRGNAALLTDLYERPDWVHECLRRITDRYFHYYDVLYDLFRDELGGSVFWAWAPGRMTKLQCDFSAMIGPEMFEEFMVPVLREMTERVSYCMYHWDGPDAIRHHDLLLSLPDLDMIQWTPGAGNEPPDHPRWWPLHHKTLEAGKRVFLHSCEGLESLKALKREFGPGFHQFLVSLSAESLEQADRMLAVVSA